MPDTPRAVGLLGGGVIGAGWAARFVLNGSDVRLFDPDPRAREKTQAVLDAARTAYRRLTLAPLPPEGSVEFVDSVADAVEGVEFVQESAPERLDVKQELLAAAGAAAADAVLCSSTSGLRPSLLQQDIRGPHRVAVGHPFNPVYLLPLVEVCGGDRTSPETLERAADIYRSVGMHPVLVRTEIDGFVADRLLEALWREALWLVADGVATVEEIDDAIRYGAGLRWAFMGTFMTYRIAGGDGGMRHFMAQFGPALEWPWSKLVNVPELTDELVDRIARESDRQADGASIRDLERVRDECLVAVLQGLRGTGVGAGATLAAWERNLFEANPVRAAVELEAPARLLEAEVPAAWVDYNGHVHESRYLQLFGDATDALLRTAGIDADYLAGRGSYFTVETHLCHLRPLAAGDHVHVTTQVLTADDKRLHVFHTLLRDAEDDPLATAEQMLLHVSAATGRAAPAHGDVGARIRGIAEKHAGVPRPERAGRSVG